MTDNPYNSPKLESDQPVDPDPGREAKFRFLAILGSVVSCLGVGVTAYLSTATLSFFLAYMLGRLLLGVSLAGLVISIVAVAKGILADIKFTDFHREFGVAVIGVVLPLGAFIYTFIFNGAIFRAWSL